jgi:hypothetical protein
VDLNASCGTSVGIKMNFAAVCVDVSNRKDVIVSLPAWYFLENFGLWDVKLCCWVTGSCSLKECIDTNL